MYVACMHALCVARLHDEDEGNEEHFLVPGELHHAAAVSQIVQGQRL